VLMTAPGEPLLTLDEAYRATFHFINQYYQREPIVPFMLMLNSMTAWSENGNLRETSDPATWNDWMASVRAARVSDRLPGKGLLAISSTRSKTSWLTWLSAPVLRPQPPIGERHPTGRCPTESGLRDRQPSSAR
jgi:hypothetical protein